MKSEWNHFLRKTHFLENFRRHKVLVLRIFNMYLIKALTTFFLLPQLFLLQKTDFLWFKRGIQHFPGVGGKGVQLFSRWLGKRVQFVFPIEPYITCAFRRVGGGGFQSSAPSGTEATLT